MKERLDRVSRYVAFGYPILMLITMFSKYNERGWDLFKEIDNFLFYGNIHEFVYVNTFFNSSRGEWVVLHDFRDFPTASVLTIIVLFVIRYIASGKTY